LKKIDKAANDILIFIDTTDKKELEMKIETNSQDESLLLNCHESYHSSMLEENLRISNVLSPKAPFLGAKASYLPEFTLVLDMDDTLLFCDQEDQN
jgi:hypothetical protein